jgi:signal recognition particle subunit SEC65
MCSDIYLLKLSEQCQATNSDNLIIWYSYCDQRNTLRQLKKISQIIRVTNYRESELIKIKEDIVFVFSLGRDFSYITICKV